MIDDMKNLFSLFSQLFKKNQDHDTNREDVSYLKIIQQPGFLCCNWKIRDETRAMIDREFGSRLYIRLREASGDGSNSCKTVEFSSNTTSIDIELPSLTGKILIDLAYKFNTDFITLEYQLFNFGPKKIERPKSIDWFTTESPNIHQEMFELASNSKLAGGSDACQNFY